MTNQQTHPSGDPSQMAALARRALISADTEASLRFGHRPPQRPSKSSESAVNWKTPWHDHVGEDGILTQHGKVRVHLPDDEPQQWIISVKRQAQDKWVGVSFHLEEATLLKRLWDKQSEKGGEHLAPDYEAVRQELAML
ncbi:hypothetical protein [Roseivivax sp. THAF30]|uniref:hypothetical protein n=1 Tax=Roseivivax sp. THAF30 TaxID=2587852 RepID=UPI0012679787|nr:hypothetical protein [Roseivivax sp. THAF30]QFT62562.1 hypothetical protein FIU91_06460 [Roseivivax sp. THAF30]